MTKNKHYKQEDSFHAVEESLTKTEQFIQKNQNTLSTIIVIILAVVAAYLAYERYIALPNEQEAQSQIFMAERYFEKDSFNLALNGDGNYMGFNQIIDNYSGTRSGNLAYYYAGIANLKSGQFQTAIDLLEKFDADDAMVNPISKGAIGDAYCELGNYEEAAKYYKKASGLSNNTFTAPYFLFKTGKMYEKIGDLNSALEVYNKIDKEYHNSAEARNIEKYITRVKIKLNKN